jgi:hypothetical protein
MMKMKVDAVEVVEVVAVIRREEVVLDLLYNKHVLIQTSHLFGFCFILN